MLLPYGPGGNRASDTDRTLEQVRKDALPVVLEGGHVQQDYEVEGRCRLIHPDLEVARVGGCFPMDVAQIILRPVVTHANGAHRIPNQTPRSRLLPEWILGGQAQIVDRPDPGEYDEPVVGVTLLGLFEEGEQISGLEVNPAQLVDAPGLSVEYVAPRDALVPAEGEGILHGTDVGGMGGDQGTVNQRQRHWDLVAGLEPTQGEELAIRDAN